MAGDSAHPVVTFGSKKELYAYLAVQVEALSDMPSRKFIPLANTTIALANVSALLFYELNRHANTQATLQDPPLNWIGFYLLQSPQLLALGPFQGRPACTEIPLGRGVCGVAAQNGETLCISDVQTFPGHIACDSASKAELVVPIKSSAGHVLGVLDADSTQLAFFDDEDAIGLRRIAELLAQQLEFPMSRIFAAHPSLVQQSFPHTNTIAAVRLLPPTTTVTEAEETKSAPIHPPRFWSERIGGWHLAAAAFTRILTHEELQQLEGEIGIGAIPEVQFAFNTLKISPAVKPEAPVISFSLYDVLKSAARFYQTDTFRQVVEAQVQIPVAESWKNTPYAKFDPKVDWAWRNDYFGVNDALWALKPLGPSMPGINWELLKDTTLPLLFFHEFDMMEDDIHDHGIVSSSVRVRAMPSAFFILFRHFIRIDRHQVWMREVRLFHEYTVKLPNGQPHIVIREEIRSHDINDDNWIGVSANEFARVAEVIYAKDYYLEFKEETDTEWWHTIGLSS